MSDKPYKYYYSSAAFYHKGNIYTEYSSGCPRYAILKYHLKLEEGKTDINIKYIINGALVEYWLREHLTTRFGYDLEDEIPLRRKISENFSINGRMDGVCHTSKKVFEYKSANSKALLLSRSEKPVQNQLAQLCLGMAEQGYSNGELWYVQISQPKSKFKVVDREVTNIESVHILNEPVKHEVRINKRNKIVVNDLKYQFDLSDIYAHIDYTFECIERDELPRRPIRAVGLMNSICTYCPFFGTCNKLDSDRIHKLSDIT